MSTNNRQVIRQRMNTATKKRLYKAKNHWNVATDGMLMGAALVGGTAMVAGTGHAATMASTTGSTPVATAPVRQQASTPVTPVRTANQQVNQAVNAARPATVAAGGTITARPQQNVGPTVSTTTVRQQVTNIQATGQANQQATQAVNQYAHGNQAMGVTMPKQPAKNVTGWTGAQVTSYGNQQASRLSAAGQGNTIQASAAQAAGQPISQAHGVMAPGSAIDVSSLDPAAVAKMVSDAAAVLSATASADSLLTQTSNQYTPVITRVGGKVTAGSAINTADNMTPDEIKSAVERQIAGFSATASADDVIYNGVKSALPTVNGIQGVMHAGSAVDTSKMTPAQIASMVAHQSAMVSATAQGDGLVKSAVDANRGAIEATGGQVVAGSHINTADNMTVQEVLSIAMNQASQVNATGSAAALMGTQLSKASQALAGWGLKLQSGVAIDVSSLTVAQIQALGQSLAGNLSAMAEFDSTIASAASQISGKVQAVSGIEKPGSMIDASSMTAENIKLLQEKQSVMLSVTGSADGQIKQVVDAATPSITAGGGHIVKTSNVNTADNMTPSEVAADEAKQETGIKQAASADAGIAKAASQVSGAIKNVTGVEKPGSAINVSSLTSEQVASLVKNQETMLSATGSADTQIKSIADANQADINAGGGELIKTSNVNTADNMTPAEIASDVTKQSTEISMAASNDRKVASAVAANSAAIHAIGGVEKPGSAIDVSSLHPEIVKSLEALQEAMVNATGSADARILSEATALKSIIAAAGTSLVQTSAMNTADNMTVSEIAQDVNAQSKRLSMVGSLDAAIDSLLAKQGPVISATPGVATPGSAIDITKLPDSMVKSIIGHQTAMVNATASGDADVVSHAKSAEPDITGFGGSLTHGSNWNTANNTTVSQIAKDVAQQDQRLSETASADKALGSVVAATSGVISAVNGKTTPGKTIDTTSLSPADLAALVKYQEGMVSATGSADVAVKSHADAVRSIIEAAGGTLTSNSVINTADNMTIKEITTDVANQDSRMDLTAKGDQAIMSEVAKQSGTIAKASGVEKPGSAIDTTHLTTSQIQSIVAHQTAMVSATGSADADVQSHANASAGVIISAGGTITQSGTVNTADNMTVGEIADDVKSQNLKISAVASADALIDTTSHRINSDIVAVSGTEKPGSVIDATNMTSSAMKSLVAKQVAMMNATDSADVQIKEVADKNRADIEGIGGKLVHNGDINTADNMTVGQVSQSVQKQTNVIDATASADRGIAQVVAKNSSAIAAVSGVETPGSAIEVASLTLEQLASLVAYQEGMVNATGSADNHIRSVVNSATPLVTTTFDNGEGQLVSGTITQKGNLNTADNMTIDQINSTVASQAEMVSQVAHGDSLLASAAKGAKPVISHAGTIIKAGSTIDVSSMTMSQIQSIIGEQSMMISATKSADSVVTSVSNEAGSVIVRDGGFYKLGSTVNTADNMTPSQISMMVAADTARINAVASANTALLQLASQGNAAISNFNARIKQGSVVDLSDKTASAVSAIAASQAVIMSQVTSNNVYLQSLQTEVSAAIKLAGGSYAPASAIDVTSMTVAQIRSLAVSQGAILSATGSADSALNNALKHSAAISQAGGTLTKGSAIDATKLTASQIVAAGQKQADNVSATISADGALNTAVGKVWSQTTTLGKPVDVSTWSPASIRSMMASQMTAIGETQNANEQLSTAKSNTQNQITRIGGRIDIQSVIDTTSMTSAEIASLAASQTGKLTLTATDTDLVSSAVQKYSLVVTGSSSAVDTTKPTSSAVLSEAKSQVNHISHTSMMDQDVRDHVSASNKFVTDAGASFAVSGVYDTTMLTESTMTSWNNSEDAHLSHVGMNDSLLTSTIAKDSSNMALMTAKAISHSAMDVTSMTDSQMDSLMQSQIAVIDVAATNDSQLESLYTSASNMTSHIILNPITPIKVSTVAQGEEYLSQGSSDAHSAVVRQMAHDHMMSAGSIYMSELVAPMSAFQAAGGHRDSDISSIVSVTNDWQTVWSEVDSIEASMSVETASLSVGLSLATDTLNYLHSTGNPAIDSMAAVVGQTPGLSVAWDSTEAVYSMNSAKGTVSQEIKNANDLIAIQQAANQSFTSLTDHAYSGAGSDALQSAIASVQASAGSMYINFHGTLQNVDFATLSLPAAPSLITAPATATSTVKASVDAQNASLEASYEQVLNSVIANNHHAQSVARDEANKNAASQAAAISAAVASYSNGPWRDYQNQLGSIIGRFSGMKNNPNWVSNSGSGSWTNLDPVQVDLGNGVYETVGADGSLQGGGNTSGYTIFMNGTLNKSQIIQRISWDNPNQITIDNAPGWQYGQAHMSHYLPTKGEAVGQGNVLFGGSFVGTGTFTFHNAVHMMDNSTHDLHLTLTISGNDLENNMIDIWEQNGSINYGPWSLGDTGNNNTVYAHYWIDNGSQNYLWTDIDSDIDSQQKLTVGSAQTLSVGGQLSMVQDGDGNGWSNAAYKSTGGTDIDGTDSWPNGAVVYVHWGSVLDKNLTDDYSNTAWSPFSSDFGYAGAQQVVTPPSLDLPYNTYQINTNLAQPTTPVHLHKMDDPAHYALRGYKWDRITIETPLSRYSLNPVYQAMSSTYNQVRTKYHAYHVGVTDHFNYTRTPMSTQYNPYSNVNGYGPEDMTYNPYGTTYRNYSSDPTKVTGTKNTGYNPLSVTWQGYQTDGASVNQPPLIPDPDHPGQYIRNPKFTGYTPYDADWQSYSTDGTDIPPMILDPKHPGQYIPNPKFTGYTPWSTTWHNYSTDGTDIPPMILDPKHPGQYIPNPKFTGYTPLSNTWHGYETDGASVDQPPLIPDGHGGWKRNPKFTGYTPYSMTWHGYDSDGQAIKDKVPPMISDGHGGWIPNPKFTGYTPYTGQYHGYETDGTKIPPLVPDPQHPGQYIPNPKFTGYTPWDADWHGYGTDGIKIPPMIPDPKNPKQLIPNPKFTGYTPWDADWHGYDTDGTKIPPMIPDPKHPGQYIPNPKFTGYAPINTKAPKLNVTYNPLDSDGTKIPPMIPDPNHPGQLMPNPKFTGYTPFDYEYQPFSDDGSKIPPMIPDGHGGWKPNPKFTGYRPFTAPLTPLSTTYQPYAPAPGQPAPAPMPGVPAQPAPAPMPGAPAQPAPAPAPQVMAQPAPAPQPVSPRLQPALPQTGADQASVALLGLLGVALTVGLGFGLTLKKRQVNVK